MLPIFPSSSLDNSLVTAVLVGLFFVWFFQERLGWGLSGLVVPGYLAAVFAIQPISGAVIWLEAMVTYLLVVALSEAVPRWWPWTTLFGRDRFFLILITSVGVRLALEGAGFEVISRALGSAPSEELHSMGLVVVPLAANSLWRSGLARGMVRVGLPVFLTWLVLEGFLLGYTNLSLSSFELSYEDLARDFVSSPRAYMILLTGAYMGSLANQRWGWDFGGIIVPGLLALCWLEPLRLLATLGEAIVLAAVFGAVLRLPALRTANLTGGRPIVLVFVLGYILKFALAWGVGEAYPGFRVGELFGFGYLLPSIMALRIVRHGEPLQSMIPAVLTSFGAFGLSSIVGYLLLLALPTKIETLDLDPLAPELSFREAAHTREGLAVAGLDTALGTPGVHSLEDGALWVREGAPLAVSAQLGSTAIVDALLVVAEALDARAVHVCETSRACRQGRRVLERLGPVLTLTDGDEVVLSVRGRLPNVVKLGPLEESIGPIPLAPGAESMTLSLPTSTRLAAASFHVGRQPGRIEAPAEPPDSLGRTEPWVVRATHDAVIEPWVHWARTGDANAMGLAVGAAEGRGLHVAMHDTVSVLTGEGMVLVARRTGNPFVVHVPDGDDEITDAAFAIALSMDARFVVVDAPPPQVHTGTERRARVAHLAVLEALEALGPTGKAVTVRRLRPDQTTGADVVVSMGHATTAFDSELFTGNLEALGLVVEQYDGAAARRGLADRGNAIRDASAAATGTGDQATVYLSPGLVDALRPVDTEHPLGVATAGLERTLVLFDDREDLAAVSPELMGVLARAEQARSSRRRRDVAAWSGAVRSAGLEPRLGCHPVFGCRWLVAERCDALRCTSLVTNMSVAEGLSTMAFKEWTLGLGAASLQLTRPAPRLGGGGPEAHP